MLEFVCLYIITVASLIYIIKEIYGAIKEDQQDLCVDKPKTKKKKAIKKSKKILERWTYGK